MSPNVEEPAVRAHRLLDASGATVATAESLTGGRLAALLTAAPGASRTYVGGVVAYATEVKIRTLGVTVELLAREGVVSGACALAMAEGARRVLDSTHALSTTGVAGPDLQEGLPVGTVFVGIAGPRGATAHAFQLTGSRAQIQDGACAAALDILVTLLREEESGVG